MDGRRIECARGKVIGGSSSINAMAYVRGHRGDYDRWAAAGLATWSYAHVLPYFRRQEAWEGGANAYRGGDGPLTTRSRAIADPLVRASFATAGARGRLSGDRRLQRREQEGFGRCRRRFATGGGAAPRSPICGRRWRGPISRSRSRRWPRGSCSRARAPSGSNIAGRRTDHCPRRARGVPAGGAINSPQLLMLSGIGDPDELRATASVSSVPAGRRAESAGPFSARSLRPARNRARCTQHAARSIAVELRRAYFFGTRLCSEICRAAHGAF